MSFLCNPFFTFGLIFILNDHTIGLKQTHLCFARFSEYLIIVLDDNMNEEGV